MFPVQKIGGFSPTKAKKTDSIQCELEASTSDRLKIPAFFFCCFFLKPLLKLLGLQFEPVAFCEIKQKQKKYIDEEHADR